MRKIMLVVAASVALAACGTSPVDRTVSGAALGAGTGAAIGAIAGGPAGAGFGAAVGGLAGGATGLLTKPDQVNLGQPVWR
jgi:hypothetical protein